MKQKKQCFILIFFFTAIAIIITSRRHVVDLFLVLFDLFPLPFSAENGFLVGLQGERRGFRKDIPGYSLATHVLLTEISADSDFIPMLMM